MSIRKYFSVRSVVGGIIGGVGLFIGISEYFTEIRINLLNRLGFYKLGLIEGAIVGAIAVYTALSTAIIIASKKEKEKKEPTVEEKKRRPSVSPVVIRTIRRRPLWATNFLSRPRKFERHGVLWKMYAPDSMHAQEQSWADGPLCPDCLRELEDVTKQNTWLCPICKKKYPYPKGTTKDSVEKDFDAIRRRGTHS